MAVLQGTAVVRGMAAVVGGGPAGLTAAERLASAGLAVTVYDRMPSPGRKFLMAGRGGLNLSHSEPIDDLLRRYGPARARLEAAVRAFAPQDMVHWCRGLGQDTFVGSSGRIFPRAMKASPLLRAWLAALDGMGVRIATRHRWTGFRGPHLAFDAPDGVVEVRPDVTVLALGGASWPRLGSDGRWTGLLDGIAVAPLRPANCGFVVEWSPHLSRAAAGEPLKRITATAGGRVVPGEAVITENGIEGGVVYAHSSFLRDAIAAEGSALLELDLRPDLTPDRLRLLLDADRRGQSLSTFLRKAAGLSRAAIALLQEALHQPGQTGQPGSLAGLVKALPLRLTAPFPIERAISTAGGVSFGEVDDAFMLARRPGVFVAGEMLDWEAPTGGYLLQASMATGAAAGTAAAAWLAAAASGARAPARDGNVR